MELFCELFLPQNLGIPCFLGGMSRGLLGRKSPIQARQQRRDALKEADVVVMAGMHDSLLSLLESWEWAVVQWLTFSDMMQLKTLFVYI